MHYYKESDSSLVSQYQQLLEHDTDIDPPKIQPRGRPAKRQRTKKTSTIEAKKESEESST